MKELFFWKVWSASERKVAYVAFAILLLAAGFFISQIIHPLENVVRWNVLSELSDISTSVDILQIGQWQYSIPVPSQLVTESFIASMMEIKSFTINVFWILASLGLCLILASLTTLPRFWYLSGMALFITLIAFSRLEVLRVFGLDNRVFFSFVIAAYAGATYYVHAFRPDFGVASRVGIMLIVTALLALLVGFGAEMQYPAVAFASYTYPLWLLLTTTFILISSTEIMAGLVWLSTSGSVSKGRSGLLNFIVVAVLYLLLLLLIFLKNTRQIDWDVTLISPVYLAMLSGILGIWGFKKRSDSTEGVMPFRSSGFWIYIGLFIVAAAFGGYVAGTANDPVLETLEDFIIQGQLAMNVLFLFYILVNFYPIFKQKLAVHKVLYKPMRFGLTQTRLFGFAGLVILFSIQRLFPVNQGVAGYFNALGDLHTVSGEYALAEQYYKFALQQEFQNHKSNYALASLAIKQGDRNAAAFYFRQALLKNPSPHAYAGLSGIFTQENLFFDAVGSLQEGVRKFPGNAELMNNLGMLYAKTNVGDSAYYYLEKARLASDRPEVPATNLLAIVAKNTQAELLDTLVNTSQKYDYLSWQANWFGIQNLRQRFVKDRFDTRSVPADSVLNVSGFAYLYNYSINQARFDSMPARVLPLLAAKNPVLSVDLSLAALYAEFYSGSKLRALEMSSSQATEDDERGNFFKKLTGHWLLQLGLYDKATEAFSGVEGLEGTIGMAIANAFSDKKEVAVVLLDKLAENKNAGSIEQLKQTLFAGIKPKLLSDSLFVIAKASPSDAAMGNAVRANPFDSRIVAVASEYYRKKKKIPTAYAIVVNALRYNEYQPEIWEQYALLSLEQGLLNQAEEGRTKVEQYAAPTDYKRFSERYQPMLALIEKQRAEFL